METFSWLLAICAGNSPVQGELPAQRPVTRSFGVFFDLRLNKRLSTQSWGWWFETPSCPLWRHCNGVSSLWRPQYVTSLPFQHNGQHGVVTFQSWHLHAGGEVVTVCSHAWFYTLFKYHRWSSDAGISRLVHPKMADAFPGNNARFTPHSRGTWDWLTTTKWPKSRLFGSWSARSHVPPMLLPRRS